MRQIKNISLLLTIMFLAACIKPYDPNIASDAKNKFVVSGRITDKEGWQEVDISMSSPIESPKYIPVRGCLVEIRNDKGNGFPLTENNPGQYQVWMAQKDLTAGTSYKVKVRTSGGEILESGFDKMLTGPGVDSVYYSILDVPTSDPARFLKVMQFYVDLNATGNYSQNYKWEVEETWEYNAAHALEYYYDGTHHQVIPADSTNWTCYMNNLVKNIFTISTKNLSQNIYKKYPLHYIDGLTSRLGILYSIMLHQYAVSENAYNYWEQVRINSNEQGGGLYEVQPLAIKGNMVNMTNPDNEVLGYFYAASESTRRYFYKDVPGLPLGFSNNCSESNLGRFGWKEYGPDDYPVYYYFNDKKELKILDHECIDCRMMGGTTVKPDFWPN